MLRTSVERDHGRGVIGAIAFSSVDRLNHWRSRRWSLLFSHPEDFVSWGFESDRWIACLSDELERLDLCVLAVGGNNRRTWISQVGGRFVASHEVDELLPEDWQVRSHEHFVTIFDDAFKARRTVVYAAGTDVPSPIELAQTAAGLRARSQPVSMRRILQSV